MFCSFPAAGGGQIDLFPDLCLSVRRAAPVPTRHTQPSRPGDREWVVTWRGASLTLPPPPLRPVPSRPGPPLPRRPHPVPSPLLSRFSVVPVTSPSPCPGRFLPRCSSCADSLEVWSPLGSKQRCFSLVGLLLRHWYLSCHCLWMCIFLLVAWRWNVSPLLRKLVTPTVVRWDVHRAGRFQKKQ